MRESLLKALLEGKTPVFSDPEEWQCHNCGWEPKTDGQPIGVSEDHQMFQCPRCKLPSPTPESFYKRFQSNETTSNIEKEIESIEELVAAMERIMELKHKVDSMSEPTECTECSCEDDTINNGGKTSYYQLPVDENGHVTIHDFDEFAEWRDMNRNQFIIGKVAWTFGVGRHDATDELREINKILHYANIEKQRILKSMGK